MIGDGKEIPEELKILENIDGISIKEGLDFCGSSKAFLKFLNTFYSSIDYKLAEIKEAFDKNDLTSYTIKVHALKSTSRIIGAYELSDLARSLEEAGEKKDIAFIRDNNDKLLQLYSSYKAKLSVVAENLEETPHEEIAPEDLIDAYNALKEYIPKMDYDAVEVILDSLKEYKLPQKDHDTVDKLKELLVQMNWDVMNDLIHNL
ncbi:MAG: Hpt domain-containing protein [Butyrivibrio sp.]|uniref:Hpt domain-containing protein n=1 Tax=Butyrivibrio sp. TaxID=28121 RepID=UPI0025C09BC1|nr:Hpt domain-containing protein [Butyrivibrio sp.]MBQ6589217.1 Hpt domain-containing protein [Butyrivibrio sp.]